MFMCICPTLSSLQMMQRFWFLVDLIHFPTAYLI